MFCLKLSPPRSTGYFYIKPVIVLKAFTCNPQGGEAMWLTV
jgi:hypothetical protein